MTWFCPDAIFDGRDLRAGMAIDVAGGELRPAAHLPPGSVVERLEGTLSPGFFDLQVNGGGGHLFNDAPTVETARAIAAAHARFGTSLILPTLITDTPAKMAAAVEAARRFDRSDGLGGIHLEGPHIAPAKRGTHAVEHIRPLDGRTIRLAGNLARDLPVLLTLAPEATAPGQIAQLVEAGVTVFLGHSDCDAATARRAFAEGARGATHLFNAMSQMTARAPGLTGAAIDSRAYCSVIADGIHVEPAILRIACAARPVAGRMVLVSDALPTVGGPGAFRLYGHEIRLHDGRLVNSEGALAGAHLTMAGALRTMVEDVGASLQDALRMAVTAPAEALGLPPATPFDTPLVRIGRDLGVTPL